MKNAARAIWPPAQRVVPSEDGEEEAEAEAGGRQTTAWSVIHLPINALFNIPAAVLECAGVVGGSARCSGSRGSGSRRGRARQTSDRQTNNNDDVV